jgi:hypothetical protein
MVKKTFSIFIVVLLFSLLLGCDGGEGTPTAIKLVPEKANMIGHIDLSQILGDEDISTLYEAMPIEPGDPQTLDEAFAMAMEGIDLDSMDFGEGLIFGEISAATGDMDYGGIVVKGTFEENDLIASIKSGTDEEFTTISYKGCEINTDSDEETGIATLGSDAFVIGSMEAVKDVIDVKQGAQPAIKGAQPAISGKLIDTYNELDDGLAKVAILVPPGAIDEGLQGFAGELPPELLMELPLDALSNMDTIGITLAKEEQSITFSLKLCFTDSDSAEAVEAFIRSIISMDVLPDVPEEIQMLLPGVPEEGQALLENLLENLNVSLSGSCLDISLEMTMSEVETLIQGLFTISSERWDYLTFN